MTPLMIFHFSHVVTNNADDAIRIPANSPVKQEERFLHRIKFSMFFYNLELLLSHLSEGDIINNFHFH